MHSSLIKIKNSESRYLASAGLSEWLFAEKFWEKINISCGTLFDQFEDDEASTQTCVEIAKQLSIIISLLNDLDVNKISFSIGQNEKHEDLLVELTKIDLVAELNKFQSIFVDAVAQNTTVICEL